MTAFMGADDDKTLRERGFTLLEVVISLAVLGSVVLTVIGVMNRNIELTAKQKEETTAALLAREKISGSESAAVQNGEGSFAPQFPDYRWKQEILPTELPGFSKLLLTVTWNEGKRSYLLERYIQK